MILSSEEQALCRALTGGSGPLTPDVIAAARRHRVHYLLAAGRARLGSGPLLAGLWREIRQSAAFDAWRDQELRDLLDALAAAGIDTLLLKGAALAHMVYDAPHLRPRVDTDILIRRDELEAAEHVLGAQQWSHPAENRFELAAAQRHYVKTGPAGSLHHLDLHWRVANPLVFSDALSFEELRARAVPVPALGKAARAPHVIDALLLGCMHRVAHHDDEADLLWLWDIHLLASRLSEEEEQQFVSLASRAAMTGVCARGLDLVSTVFGTPGAAALTSRLRLVGSGRAEPSAQFIGGLRPITTLRADLAALRGWRRRVRLVAEHVFPSRIYIRGKYPGWPDVLLPLAYVDRIARGAPKWFRRR